MDVLRLEGKKYLKPEGEKQYKVWPSLKGKLVEAQSISFYDTCGASKKVTSLLHVVYVNSSTEVKNLSLLGFATVLQKAT